MRRAIPTAFALCLIAGTVSAAGIDLSKPHGNTSGCINRNGQEVYAEDMLLLTGENLVTAASACSLTGKTQNEDGSMTLISMCDVEGEEEQVPATFTVSVSASGSGNLEIADEDGFVLGEVSPCK